MDLEWEDGLDIVEKAHREEINSRFWEAYLMKYQHMDESNYMDFEEFKDLGRKEESKLYNRTPEEVIEYAENILESLRERR